MESKFTGGLLGMIGVGFWAGLITMLTCGICTPWAICLVQSWYTKHTTIDGHQLVFDGTGGELFGTFIKWILLCFVTFGIYGLWLPIKMQQWITKHTHLA